MAQSKIKVTIQPPLQQLVQAFEGFERILIKRLSEGIRGYALLVERGSKIFSPVDTGRMRASIGTSMGMTPNSLRAFVQTNVDYAIYVHEGTYKMRARPFMKWGLDAYRREGDRLIVEKIKQATRDLERKAR